MLRPGRVLAGGSPAPGAEIGAAKHRFHKCLGLLKIHTPKTPPNQPESTTICASKSTSICTSKYASIRATTSRGTGVGQDQPFLVLTGKTLFFVPSLGAKTRKARRPSKDGRDRGHRAAARSHAQPATSPASMASVLDRTST